MVTKAVLHFTLFKVSQPSSLFGFESENNVKSIAFFKKVPSVGGVMSNLHLLAKISFQYKIPVTELSLRVAFCYIVQQLLGQTLLLLSSLSCFCALLLFTPKKRDILNID